MNDPIQTVIASGVVAAAAGYLVYRGWRVVVRKQSGCLGGCSSCPAPRESENVGEPFVAVEELRRDAERLSQH